MKLVIDLEDPEALGAEVMRVMEKRGMVMVAPKRLSPYSVKEVAEAAGVSTSTVLRLRDSGVLKEVKHLGGRCLLTSESVESWMKGEDCGE